MFNASLRSNINGRQLSAHPASAVESSGRLPYTGVVSSTLGRRPSARKHQVMEASKPILSSPPVGPYVDGMFSMQNSRRSASKVPVRQT